MLLFDATCRTLPWTRVLPLLAKFPALHLRPHDSANRLRVRNPSLARFKNTRFPTPKSVEEFDFMAVPTLTNNRFWN